MTFQEQTAERTKAEGGRGGRQLWVQIVFGIPGELRSLDGNTPPSDEMKARVKPIPAWLWLHLSK